MIHHPLILGPKIAFLVLLIAVLVVLHAYLSPEQFHVAAVISVAVFVCFLVIFWIIIARMLADPDSKLARQVVLSSQQRVENGYRAASEDMTSLVGQCGVALTPLRPSGTAAFDERRITVVAEGEFIDRDARVEVIAVQGARVVVRRAAQPAGGPPRASRA
ncbi:MAG: NfeD family protein [Planctomycetota bacterium]